LRGADSPTNWPGVKKIAELKAQDKEANWVIRNLGAFQ